MDGMPNIASLVITSDVLKFVGAIDEFKGAWKAIGRIAPERLSALRHVATIESAASSTRIEGAKLTDREVELLLSNLDSKSFTSRRARSCRLRRRHGDGLYFLESYRLDRKSRPATAPRPSEILHQ